MSWTSIQLGSREHYAVPIALHEKGMLDRCITDSWLSKSAARRVRPIASSLAGRRSDQLPDSKVTSATAGRLVCDAWMKLRRLGFWDSILERNDWFGKWAAKESARSASPTVFCYAYTARLPFAGAQRRNARCILGQIDPGPREDEVVIEATKNYRDLAPPADRAPQKYWDLWQEEIAMADKIVVNSPWSAKLLEEAGVPAAKLVEIPLVYELAESAAGSIQSSVNPLATRHLSHVTGSRPRLQALFLGSVILRKGVGQLFDAIKMLKKEPVDFTFAGPLGVKIPVDISQLPNVRFLGPVDKAMAQKLYRESDVFLFPTLSDGFGLTQLEALGHGLPVIASTHCGQVVQDRVSGLVLTEVSPEVIVGAIMELLRDRELLDMLRSNAFVLDKCHPRHLAPALLSCAASG